MPETEHFSSSELQRFVAGHAAASAARGFRAVVVLSGEAAWCREQAAGVLAALQPESVWWLGGQAATGCEALEWSRARTRLGMEVGLLVVDALEGFDAEGFGALSGTVEAG
ncbi:MAG TPA: hypothetical protein VIQ22_08155, partial [Gammaproteobacteria bacterium]